MGLAKQQLATIVKAFQDLWIPLAEDKVEGPTLLLMYLGIMINSQSMTIEVPMEEQTH